jgi:hypothetical protein
VIDNVTLVSYSFLNLDKRKLKLDQHN